jgi:predicted TIM-barrel fold metal-dependent hydrolase
MSRILEQWVDGQGFPGTLVIDGHIHINGWPHGATFRSLDEAAAQSVAYLDAHGIDAFCSLGGGGFITGDYRLGNDFLLALWRRIPELMIPFMGMNPNDTCANILSELERMRAAGVRGIKLINAYQHNYPGDGPNLMIVYEFAARHNMLVINHGWKADEILKISEKFPEVDFIFAHYCGGQQDEVMKARKNVHANIWAYGSMGWLERGIKNCGAEKFMLGSDGFLNSLSLGLGPVVFAPISDQEKRLILGLNLAKLLDKVNALPPKLKARLSSS